MPYDLALGVLIFLADIGIILSVFSFRGNPKRYTITAGIALILVLLNLAQRDLIMAGVWTFVILVQAFYLRSTSRQ